MSRIVFALLLAVSSASSRARAEPAVSGYQSVRMQLNVTELSARELRMVAKLADATRLLDELFWEQSDPQGWKLYRSIVDRHDPQDEQLARRLVINGGRYDLIAENSPFAGAPPRPPGAHLYPPDLTRAELDAYVAKHPADRAKLYDPLTVVRRRGRALIAVPYHEEYRHWLVPMSRLLNEAAGLSDDAAFASFLRLRAKALLSDDYFPSDAAWVDLVNPKFDLIFAPYETYLDDFLGVKASYGAAVLIRNEAESKKLEVFQRDVPSIQEALPLSAQDRPSKAGHATPMEVMDSPVRGGDLRHGYQAVADNLPNDPRIHEQKGTKKIFFKNYMDARVEYVILPIARRLLREDQARMVSAQGYLTTTLMHEISHGLGPAFARTPQGKRDIREMIGAQYAGLEEAKADIVGLFGLKWLVDHGRYPADALNGSYASEVAGIFRAVRFGIAEAHGRAEIMEFNYFVERSALELDAALGRYVINFERMPDAIAGLARELLEQEATGDAARVSAWFIKYGSMPAELAQALKSVSDVPVDIEPVETFETHSFQTH